MACCYHASIIRTQISLEPDQMERLRDLAHARGTSVAALVREGVAVYLDEAGDLERTTRARAASGRFRWTGNALDHDEQLADVFGR